MKLVGKMMVVALMLLAFVVASNASAKCKQPPKPKITIGMKVYAQWQGNNWWVGTVKSRDESGNFRVLYSDKTWGDNKRPYDVIPHPDELYTKNNPPCFKKGDGVIAKWRGDSLWRATVDSVAGNMANITYSDKTKGKVRLSEMVPDYR